MNWNCPPLALDWGAIATFVAALVALVIAWWGNETQKNIRNEQQVESVALRNIRAKAYAANMADALGPVVDRFDMAIKAYDQTQFSWRARQELAALEISEISLAQFTWALDHIDVFGRDAKRIARLIGNLCYAQSSMQRTLDRLQKNYDYADAEIQKDHAGTIRFQRFFRHHAAFLYDYAGIPELSWRTKPLNDEERKALEDDGYL